MPDIADSQRAEADTTSPSGSVLKEPTDSWAQDVRAADFPLAVAYGFPDDEAAFAKALITSYGRKVGACMRNAGYQFVDETGPRSDDNAQVNADTQGLLDQDLRVGWNAMFDKCTTSAAAATFVSNAFPDTAPLFSGKGFETEEQMRSAQLEWILRNRSKIQRLAEEVEP